MFALRFRAGRALLFVVVISAIPFSGLFSQITIREKISINPISAPAPAPLAIGDREWFNEDNCWMLYLNPQLPDDGFQGESYHEYRWLLYGDVGYVYDLFTDLSFVNSVDFTGGAEYIDVFDAQTGARVGTTGLPGKQYRFRLKEPHPTLDELTVVYSVSYYGFVDFVHTLFIRPVFVLTTFVETSVLQSGGSTVISIDAVNNCLKDPPLSDSATYRAFVTSGSHYGTLVNTARADTADTLFNIAQHQGFTNSLLFLANGASPGQDTVVTMRIESDYPHIAPRDVSISLSPGGQVRFKVILDPPDTLAFTESSRIFVQAQDTAGNDVELADNTPLRFSIDSTDYGSFISVLNDTVPAQLTNVLYSDARIGNIRFAAVNKNPDSLMQVRVIVKMQDDTTQTGDTTLVLLEQTLRIVMDAPYEVQPVIPPTTVNNPRAENRKNFSIKMTRGGKPVPNHPFRLTTDYVDRSGGHDHFADRRNVSFRRENHGHFILTRTNSHVDRPYQGHTQINGLEEFQYVASIWGDSMRIKIKSAQLPKLLKDSVTIAERVPELELLPEGTSYVKVGGRNEHRGPPDFTEDRNHFGTNTLIENVIAIADSFVVEYQSYRLRVNDMSLPFGGAFDINGNWEQDVIEPNCRQRGSGHCGHRRGQNADISFQIINPRGQLVPMTDRQRLLLLQIITLTAGAPHQHSSHLHVQ